MTGSATKQSSFLFRGIKAGLLRFARNDGKLWRRDLAARFARVLPGNFRPLQSEGAGNAGRTMHPQPRMQNKISIRA
jgi:hypothetical protein